MSKVSRRVGRPKKRGRDAAIYIARWWRMTCLGESIASADKWLLQHWSDITPPGESVGISDVAHVRAAIRRTRETWLRDASFICNDGIGLRAESIHVLDPCRTDWQPSDSLPDDFQGDACSIAAVEFVLHGRPKVLFWAPGMREARLGHAFPIDERTHDGPTYTERQGRTFVAVAIAEYFGLSRLGRIERIHRPGNPWIFGSAG